MFFTDRGFHDCNLACKLPSRFYSHYDISSQTCYSKQKLHITIQYTVYSKGIIFSFAIILEKILVAEKSDFSLPNNMKPHVLPYGEGGGWRIGHYTP
jgi:hypothetical protein